MKYILAIAMTVGVGATANAQFIMDQIGPNSSSLGANGFASQDFEAANNAFDVNAIDDFTVGIGHTITSVEAVLFGNNGFVNYNLVTGYRVEVYSSVAAGAASLTGNVGSQLVAPGSVTVNTSYIVGNPAAALVTIPVNIVVPSAGTYWIGVMPVNDFTAHGQTWVLEGNFGSGFPNGTNAWQLNPGLGFQGGSSFPTNPAANLAYRVTAAPVPEPATMATLAAALGALALRRRKRS